MCTLGAKNIDCWNHAYSTANFVTTSNCTELILPNFFVNMWLWTRPGLTTSNRKPKKQSYSILWKHPTSPPVVKFWKVISASKVMASVFWDS